MTFKYYLILLSCFILKQGLVAQIVPPPATQSEVDAGANRFKYVTPYTLANRAGGSGGSSTNEAQYAYGFRTGPSAMVTRTNLMGFSTSTTVSNFMWNAGGDTLTNLAAGYFYIDAGFNYYAVSNDVMKIMVATNGVLAANLIAYSDYSAAVGGGAFGTNFVKVSGIVYLPANSYVRVYSDWAESVAQTVQLYLGYINAFGVGVGTIGGSGGSGNAVYQMGSTALTNLSSGITNEVWWNAATNIVTAFSNMVSGTRYHLAADATWPVRAYSALTNGIGAINIFNKTNIEVIGHGGVIWATNIGDVFFVTNSENLEFRGLTVRGTVITNYVGLGAVGVVWGAFDYFACRDLRLYHNRFIDHHDHGVLDIASQGTPWIPATTNVVGRFNYFYNGGSRRTNEGVMHDGTAIVPAGGDWTDNRIELWLRGIEPYIENLSGSPIAQNILIARNRIINPMDDGILTAGSTNAHGLIIEDNIVEWHPGATWRGSNFIVSASGININGGQRVKILRNKIYFAPNFGISITGDLTKHGYLINDNTDFGHFYTTSGGGGIQISSTSGLYPNSGFEVSRNFIENKRVYGLAIAGLRDSSVRDNTLLNTGTNAYTRAFWVYTDGSISVSNVVIDGTTILNDERAAGAPSRGIDIESAAKALRVLNTHVAGIATKVNNGAGAEVLIRNHDAGDTNQIATIATVNTASNAVFSATGLRIGTNASPSIYTNLQFVTPANTVVSNAGNGTASIHFSGSGGGSTQMVAAAIGTLTVTNEISLIGDGSEPGEVQLFGTNNNAVVMRAAISNSVPVTNVVGLVHKAYAAYIAVNCNLEQNVHITNRIAGNVIVDWLNAAQGQTLNLRLHGAASGGTDYFVTNTFPAGWLAANQSSNTAPLAVQIPVSVLDGTGAEINIRNYRLFTGTTNIAGMIINTYTE